MSQITNNRRKRAIRRWIAVILILVIGPAVWLVYDATRDRSPSVQTATLATGNITSVMMINTVIRPGSAQETYISSELVKSVRVKPGDQVKKGDILVTFDLTEFKNALATATKARKQAESAAAQASRLAADQAESAADALESLQRQINKLSSGLSGASGAVSKLGSTSPVQVDVQDGLAESIAGQLALIDPSSPDAACQIQEIADSMLAGVKISCNPEFEEQMKNLNQSVNKMGSSVTGLLTSLGSGNISGLLGGSSITSQLGSLSTSAQTIVSQAIQAEALAKKALDNAVESIKAETDGIVAEVNAKAGEYAGSSTSALGSSLNSSLSSALGGSLDSSLGSISGSQKPVIVLYDNTHPKAYFQANRLDSSKLAVDMPVIYTQDGGTWSGKITYKGRIASNVSLSDGSSSDSGSLLGSMTSASGLSSEPMIDIEMSIEGKRLTDLTLGFNLDAEIQTASAENVLLLPAEAMKKELGEYFVFVVGSDNRLERRTFTPGIQSDLFAEIVSGLKAGEKVVLNPSNDLTDGMHVKVKDNDQG